MRKWVVQMKTLILVTSPPACGKTYVSKKLAEHLKHVVYLDKDTLIVLSKQIFNVAGKEYNRSSPFFEENIRNYEYDAIVAIALEALDYEDIVLINAPFSREVRNNEYMADLENKLKQKNARLIVIWVNTDVEICHQRMIKRNSSRDKWKLEHWPEYIAGVNFTIPTSLGEPDIDGKLFTFDNNDEEGFTKSMQKMVKIIENNDVEDVAD